MISKYLISTPLELTWPKNLESKLIFASESAILTSDGKQKKYSSYFINDFRWKDKKKLEDDFNYLNDIYEKLLDLFCKELNVKHKTNYSERFWRILIGPWLSCFIHVYFERWKNIETIFSNHTVDKCIFLDFDESNFVSLDNREFSNYISSDIWNQFLYQSIIKIFLNKDKIEVVKYNDLQQKKKLKESSFLFQSHKNNFTLKNLFLSFFNFFDKSNYEYLIYKSSIGFKNELNLSLKFNQFPLFFLPKLRINKNKDKIKIREQFTNLFKAKNNFEKNLFDNLIQQFPKIYLEHFDDLENYLKKTNLPKKPKAIFTSHALWYDTKATFYIAKMTELNSKIYCGQHGGAFGISKIHWPEKHEKKISDKFLSWGWNNVQKNIKPFYVQKNLKMMDLKRNKNLIMLKMRKRYFHSLDSSSGTEKYSDFISNVSKFLFHLDKPIKDRTVLRVPPSSDNFNSVDYYSDLKGSFNFDNSENLNKAYCSSKVVVHPSNSTTLLETMYLDIPTLIVLNKNNNPISDLALDYFKELESAKVLFYDPLEAATFLNKIWENDINVWWNDFKTKKATLSFVKNFANKSENLVEDLFKILK